MKVYIVLAGYDEYNVRNTSFKLIKKAFLNKEDADKFASVCGPNYYVEECGELSEADLEFMDRKEHFYIVYNLKKDVFNPVLIAEKGDDVETLLNYYMTDSYPKEKYNDRTEISFLDHKFLGFTFNLTARDASDAIRKARERRNYINVHVSEFPQLAELFSNFDDKSCSDWSCCTYNYATKECIGKKDALRC